MIIIRWRVYKQKVATFGAIMIDPSLEYVLLVQGCQSSNWGYPKGKRNEDELAITCAIREVKEETGYDITGKIDRDNFTEHVLNQQLSRLATSKRNLTTNFLKLHWYWIVLKTE